jgi:hypothetical protein
LLSGFVEIPVDLITDVDKRRSNALVWYSPKVVALLNSVGRAEEEVASIYME